MNLAGRAGRWSADNWKKALFGWLLFAALARALGSVVGHVQMRPANENVLIHSSRFTASDPIMVAAIGGVVQTLAVQQNVINLQNPLNKPGSGLVSRDGHSVLVQFNVQGDPDSSQDKIKPILDAVAGAQRANPDVSIREVGFASGPAMPTAGKRIPAHT